MTISRTPLSPTPLARTTLAALGGLGLVGALAGCAGGTAASDGTDTGSATSGAPYADGTYTASGSYVSPHGPETVDVTVTLESDTVTSVEVVGHGDNPDSQRYQGFFIDGIAAEVVGKSLDDISVDKVGGSSLTSGGFEAALAEIKAEASA